MGIDLVKPTIDYIDILMIDNAIDQMVRNDVKLLAEPKVAPKIWCCKWYNSASKNNLTYKKGDAVWINTEDVDLFTLANKAYIINIINNNSLLRSKYKSVSDNEYEVLQLCKDVVTGRISGNSQQYPLYYLGDIKLNTLIRVSLIDDNDKLPSDNSAWKDFFKNSDTLFILNTILSSAAKSCLRFLDLHLRESHLSGILDYWHGLYDKLTSLSDIYLLLDMSNVNGLLFHTNSPGKADTGFDYVVFFNLKKYSNGCWKWCRVWNSGLLEHGGIIDVSNPSTTGDTKLNNKLYQVTLNWMGTAGSSPIYKYGFETSNGFYLIATDIDLGDNAPIRMNNIGKLCSEQQHYVVSLTPISGNNTPYLTLHPHTSNTNGFYYTTNDVSMMTNSSFAFVIGEEYLKYSYHVIGFSRNILLGYK